MKKRGGILLFITLFGFFWISIFVVGATPGQGISGVTDEVSLVSYFVYIIIAVFSIVLLIIIYKKLKTKSPAASLPYPLDELPLDTSKKLRDNAQFTVYRPSAIVPEKWYSLLFFAHPANSPENANEDELDPLEEVERQAREFLKDELEQYSQLKQDSSTSLPEEGQLSIKVDIEGVVCNPPEKIFYWYEPVHREIFRIKTTKNYLNTVCRGRISVYFGSICVADIQCSIRVDDSHPVKKPTFNRTSTQMYRKIFTSYSHEDEKIVTTCVNFVASTGDRYLRDVIALRSGEIWNERLQELIGEADIFQLFWSPRSMVSPYVRREWEYALTLDRQNFIRPVFWDDPFPEDKERKLPPEELKRFHFYKLPVGKGDLSFPDIDLQPTVDREVSPDKLQTTNRSHPHDSTAPDKNNQEIRLSYNPEHVSESMEKYGTQQSQSVSDLQEELHRNHDSKDHHIFISYSSEDKPVADAICNHLESKQIRCWIAPRDILPGMNYQESIIEAIDSSLIVVLVFSSHSNTSVHVLSEVNEATSNNVIIVPFRIEDILPSKSVQYLIGVPHWVDAVTPPLEQHIQRLADTTKILLDSVQKSNNNLIFISAKSEDFAFADQVYKFLTGHGYSVFFSQKTLPVMGSSDYRKEIDHALEKAKHLIVVTSKREYVESSWVEAEWGLFINEKRSGRKQGSMITLIAGSMKISDLPGSLRYYEVIPFDPMNFDKILKYLN
jgi:hypothetical protein